MKYLMFTGLLAAAALSVVAAPQSNVRKLAPGVVMTQTNGLKQLRLLDAASKESVISRPVVRKAPARAPKADMSGMALYESFEGWDGTDMEWTPEGWSVEMRGEVERDFSWTPSGGIAYTTIQPTDGRVLYGVSYSSSRQDEWLISPEVTVGEGMILSYNVYVSPLYIFSLDNIDWESGEYIGDKIIAENLQVMVQPEGGEWTVVRDFAENYKHMTYDELTSAEPMGLERFTDNLEQYVGQKIRVAFRVVGSDGNTICLDEVAIGMPQLDGVSYMEPLSTLYWGFDRTPAMAGLMADIALHPVYEPVTWQNMMSAEDNVEFTWTFTDPETGRQTTSDNRDELTLTFYPDYSTDETKRNNLFYPPTLTASAPNAAPGSYMAPYAFFQAGGTAERTLEDGTEFRASLLPFGYNNSGVTIVQVDDQTIGDYALPVFGHNYNTDEYWINYSVSPEDRIDGNYSHLEAIANLFLPTAAPLVVNGITVNGYGKISDDAKFAATIYGVEAVDGGLNGNFESLTVIATDTIMGSSVLSDDRGELGPLCFPFDFDEPVVVKSTEQFPAYFVMFSGFRSDKVEYFAPYQSEVPDPNYLCLGYILNHIRLNGHGSYRGDDPYYSLKQMVYIENGDYVDPYASFAIGLNAEYPWLTTECEGLELTADAESATASLGSYYDGAQLSVEAPEGLTATVAGRYDECVLTVSRSGGNAVDGVVKVTGPGVEVNIPVKAAESAIAEIMADGMENDATMYDLSGRRIKGQTKGVVIVKSADGSARKAILK